MQTQCRICRKTIAPGGGVMMQAFGRPLFAVHADPCANTVRAATRFLAGVTGIGTRRLLEKRSPLLLKLTDGAVRALKGR